ncbi:MAG TPA: mechanosensitive ion channel family protein [Chitinophagaceae bacterium]
MGSIWDDTFWGNTLKVWLTAMAITLFAVALARILQAVVLKKVKRIAERTNSTVDDFLVRLLQRGVMPLLYFVAIYTGIRYLELPQGIVKIVHAVFMVIVVFYIIRGISDLFSYIFQRFTRQGGDQVKQAKGILLIIKIMLWIAGIVFLLDNLGYNITTIVTGLGIGGIAIALAAQAVLADLFSYLVIFFDKPFEAGDYIVVGDKSGIVEYIGIKTTRLRTLGGEQLIMSNTDLTNSRVQNYKRMEKRRVLLTIGVTYETSTDKLKKIPAIVREIIGSQEQVVFDRTHFSGFGDFCLNFEIVYYILTADYLQYMDSQQAFCLSLYERFEKEHIDFAYPTQKLLLTPLNHSVDTG